MASNSETGHAVNISNFKLLIDTCTAFGIKYNPSNTSLTIANMTAQWTAAKDANSALINSNAAAKEPINEREILFAPIINLVTEQITMLNSRNEGAM